MSNQAMRVAFLGAAGAVTGSKYLLEIGAGRVLIDCGLFQGVKRPRERNWQPLPFDPRSLDAVLLTHAHIDHAGYLPVLAREGYHGPVYCTEASRRLLSLVLPDAAPSPMCPSTSTVRWRKTRPRSTRNIRTSTG